MDSSRIAPRVYAAPQQNIPESRSEKVGAIAREAAEKLALFHLCRYEDLEKIDDKSMNMLKSAINKAFGEPAYRSLWSKLCDMVSAALANLKDIAHGRKSEATILKEMHKQIENATKVDEVYKAIGNCSGLSEHDIDAVRDNAEVKRVLGLVGENIRRSKIGGILQKFDSIDKAEEGFEELLDFIEIENEEVTAHPEGGEDKRKQMTTAQVLVDVCKKKGPLSDLIIGVQNQRFDSLEHLGRAIADSSGEFPSGGFVFTRKGGAVCSEESLQLLRRAIQRLSLTFSIKPKR
jgi:hypothetical protein